MDSRTQASIGELAHASLGNSGGASFLGGSSDQWFPHAAPSWIHRLSNSRCWGVTVFRADGGGMTKSGSWLSIRRRISLCSGEPAATARLPSRTSFEDSSSSSLRSAWRWAASGPWQWKQCSESIGRISSPKSIDRDAPSALCWAKTGPSPDQAIEVMATRQPKSLDIQLIQIAWKLGTKPVGSPLGRLLAG